MAKKIFGLTIVFLISLCFSSFSQSSFYTTDAIEELKIEFEQDNWPYLLDSLRYNGEELLLGDITINGTKYEDVGIRYEEGRGFLPGRKRNSLFVKLDFIKKTQNHEGFRSLFLSNALRDPSMVREVLGYEIARSYMAAPLANYARVFVNNSYYGLLVNVEVVDQVFLEKHFGRYTGDLFRGEPLLRGALPTGCGENRQAALQVERDLACYQTHFKAEEDANWGALAAFTRSLQSSDYENVLHVDPTLWMLAFNNVLVNLDSYTGNFSDNYYLYRDENGKFVPILGKLNFVFGSYKNTGIGSDLELPQLVTLDPLLHSDNLAKPLISKLLNDELQQKVYLSHVRTVMKDYFTNGLYAERVRQLQKLIEKDRLADADNRYTSDEFYRNVNQTIGVNSQIPGIVELMGERADFLRKHPAMLILPPPISDINVERRKRFSNERIETFKVQAKVGEFAKVVRLYYRFEEEGPFSVLEMKDDGQNNDILANDEIYGIEIIPPQGVRKMFYYIMAENAKAVRFDPSHYIFEQHVADLVELNK